mgnify:FL=1|jgi:hypothetical protein|tara:strand:+ start:53 stop:283 length:231 start_codon:yes stop_codon:yes gene_type:complete
MIKEDLNRKHKFTLTEGQSSIILYILEDYMLKGDTSGDPDLPGEIDAIIEELEGTVDKFYDKIAKLTASKPKPEWD